MCSGQSSQLGGGTFHKIDYLRLDKFNYKNRVLFIMIYEFECMMKDSEHTLVALALTIKSDYRDILESSLDYLIGVLICL